ncbi:hypothetical protein B0I35DRAFT_478612 [Stachybotrys elegans]|uniref:Zn(2)-C6 fungal-type domain-containing protein n=1 Tax=Stachybotrys elegans TaxID=80388 RepID=A0A8K0SLE4_9HYPO|nr:hypothetical protein B0I35DRAFT_478612 [Stachybotrys elegans]
MPGVPLSRGCDACRRKKKKCDLAKPACSRCVRVGAHCTGSDTKRYKFLHGLKQATPRDPGPRAVTSPDPLAMVPANATTYLTGSFIQRLEMQDVRYDLTNFGPFLKLLPLRIGRNRALDASADALQTAFGRDFSRDGNNVPTMQALKKYGIALKALQEALASPTAHKHLAELLCSIYMVMLVQGWIGAPEGNTTHEQGLQCLAEMMVVEGPRDEFDIVVLSVISAPLIMSGLTDRTINLSPRYWEVMAGLAQPMMSGPELADINVKPHASFPSLHFSSISLLPRFMRRPELYHDEIQTNYRLAMHDVPRITERLASLGAARGYMDSVLSRTRRDLQGALCLALSSAIGQNHILQAYYPDDQTLPTELADLVQQMVKVAEQACKFAPLGAGFITGGLSAACASTDDPVLQKHIRSMLDRFFWAFHGDEWNKMPDWWYYRFMWIRCRLGNPKPGDDPIKAAEMTSMRLRCVQCSASHNNIELVLR